MAGVRKFKQRMDRNSPTFKRFHDAVVHVVAEKGFPADAIGLVEGLADRYGATTAIHTLRRATSLENLEVSGDKLAGSTGAIPFVEAEPVESQVDYRKRMKEVRDRVRSLFGNLASVEQSDAEFETARAILLLLRRETTLIDYLSDGDKKQINWQVLEQFFGLGNDPEAQRSFERISTNLQMSVEKVTQKLSEAFSIVAGFVERYGEVALLLHPVLHES